MNIFVPQKLVEKRFLVKYFSNYDKIRNVQLPEKSKYLAEFFGILFGDGHLIEKGRIHRIGITLNLTEDIDYSKYVVGLIKFLFNISPKIKIRKKLGRLDILISSKALTNFLLQLGFLNGRKKDGLVVPKWVKNNEIYIKSFIRGIMDTDGSLFFAKRGTYKVNEYPVIEIKMHDERFIKELAGLFKKINFPIVYRKNKIQINGTKLLHKWVEEIGIYNINSFSRYSVWKHFGYLKPNTKLKARLKMLGWQNPAMHIA